MQIVVQPFFCDPKKYFGYELEYIIVESEHRRFTVGSRFDFGFLSIAIEEGWSILFRPIVSICESEEK